MTLWEAGIDRARREANKLLQRCGVESTSHVNVEGFARRLKLDVVDGPLDGADGQLVVTSEHRSIIPSDRLANAEHRRWVIAHELGHYVLEHDSPLPEALLGPRPRCRAPICRTLKTRPTASPSPCSCPSPRYACSVRPAP